MSVVSGMLDSMKGNKMIKTELLEFAKESTSGELVEFAKRKVDLSEQGAYVYALSLVWSLSDEKLREKVVLAIEEYN